jgi:hypothetical protein
MKSQKRISLKHFPDEIIIIISSYYGCKIPHELSSQIKDENMLQKIREKEYYNPETKTWHLFNVGNILLSYSFIYDKYNDTYINTLWKNMNTLITKMWHSCSEDQRKLIICNNFPYCLE